MYFSSWYNIVVLPLFISGMSFHSWVPLRKIKWRKQVQRESQKIELSGRQKHNFSETVWKLNEKKRAIKISDHNHNRIVYTAQVRHITITLQQNHVSDCAVLTIYIRLWLRTWDMKKILRHQEKFFIYF